MNEQTYALLVSIGVNPDSQDAAADFFALLASWPRDWEPLTVDQVAAITCTLEGDGNG